MIKDHNGLLLYLRSMSVESGDNSFIILTPQIIKIFTSMKNYTFRHMIDVYDELGIGRNFVTGTEIVDILSFLALKIYMSDSIYGESDHKFFTLSLKGVNLIDQLEERGIISYD